MNNVLSVAGAIIIVSIIGAFLSFECPFESRVPKPEELYVVKKPIVSRI